MLNHSDLFGALTESLKHLESAEMLLQSFLSVVIDAFPSVALYPG